MNLAVKFYKNESTIPFGMPLNWPKECIQDNDDRYADAIQSGVYMVMSLDEYNAYIDANQGAYDLYTETYLNEDGIPHPILSATGIYLRVKNWLGL